jgi:alpha-L-rhamnosidase
LPRALGAVADWMHRVVAGLAPDAPGYARIRFAPRPGGELTWALAEHETPYGRAAIAWRRDDDEIVVTLTVPVGTRAVLDLGTAGSRELDHGDHEVRAAWAEVIVA